MTRFILIALLLPLAAPAAYGRLPPLAELEARIEGSGSMQLLDAQYELALRRLELERQRNGMTLYSSATYSDNDEVVDVGRSRSYRQLGGGIGLRLPVLGSRLEWQESVSRHELQLARRQAERELHHRELLRKLRIAYAQYWAAQRLTLLSETYLDSEPKLERSLQMRTRAGLLLDSDRLELMSAFALARRDHATASAQRQSALAAMRAAVQGPLDGGFAARPQLHGTCAPDDRDIDRWATTHPEVAFLRLAAAHVDETHHDSPLYGVSSEIRVGYHTSTEWPTRQQGGSAAITWSFEVPVNFLNQRRIARASAAAERSHAQLEHELRRAEIQQELRTLLADRAMLEQSLHFATVRLAAGEGAVRERELRAAHLPGDVIEQLQQARVTHYNAAKAVLEAETSLARWSADWAMLAPHGCRPRSIYVWSSHALLTRLATAPPQAPVLDDLPAERVATLLVSLDRDQINRYERDPEPLRAALDGAHARGLRVELLLGEPTWLLPEHRSDLLRIVRGLAALPFDGLHLDIEPSQLAHLALPEETLLQGLVETVQAVRSLTPWPLDVSLHPRDLSKNVGGRALGEHFQEAGTSVTLMIYVSNPERVIEIAEPLLRRFPGLSQRVALSIEATLGREESLYHVDEQERARRISEIESRIDAANFRGITLQPEPQAPAASLVVRN